MIPIPVVGPAEPWRPAPSGPAARPDTPVGAVDHTPAPRPPGPTVRWWLSGYDNQVHAFRDGHADRDFVEALCEHSVPVDRITRTDAGTRCVACVLVYGDLLAERRGDPGHWRP